MAQPGTPTSRDRLVAAVGTVALQAGLLAVLITGLDIDISEIPSQALKVYDLATDPPPPPPPPEEIPADRTEEKEGAAAPPNLRSKPTPVIAPKPRIKVPPKMVAARDKSPIEGLDPSAGASDRAGPGTGSGGFGTGTGSGRSGLGGGSGIGARARRVRGGLSFQKDYPRAARKVGAQGSVSVCIAIGADGRVTGCTVTGSSGNGDLDRTTCSLIVKRFHYTPARNSSGQAIASVENTIFDWRLLP